MRRHAPWEFLSPSSTLLKFVGEIAFPGAAALDLACGFGRNAVLLAAHGCDVVCADRDVARLRHLDATKAALLAEAPPSVAHGQIATICADFAGDLWPFKPSSFDAIIIVHFVRLALFPILVPALRIGGHLYFETFGGQGENHLALPQPGEANAAPGSGFELRYYEERPASRKNRRAVAVKMLARRME